MRRMTLGGVATCGAAIAWALFGAAACAPKSPSSEPYLQRMTVTGEHPFTIESCVDPATMQRFLAAAKARVPDGKPKALLVGCTHSFQRRTDGSTHAEMTCDRAAGAARSYHRISDGTLQDMRTHTETYGFDPDSGAPKTTVRDSRTVRLGRCPPDLKPGQARGPDGTILNMPSPERMLARLSARNGASGQ